MNNKRKKGKKSKKKILIKKIRIILILIILILITVFIYKSINGSNKLTKAMSTVDKYMSYLNESKYSEMYDMLTVGTKRNITKEDFITRNEEIYGQIEASSITVSNMSEEEQENRKSKSYIY